MIKKILKSKWTKLLISINYCFLFYRGYTEFLSPYFGYAGFNIIPEREKNIEFLVITFIIATIPIFFYRGIKNISSFIFIFIYFILYIPVLFNFYFDAPGSVEYIFILQILFMLGMLLFVFADRINFKRQITLPTSVDVFSIVRMFCILSTLYIAFVYRSNLKFVSFENVYEQRFGNSGLGNDIFTGYINIWLSNVFIPVCIAYGFYSKSWSYVLTGIAGSLIIYMATAAKSVLLFPLILFIIYRLLRRKDLDYSFLFIGAALSLIMFFTLLNGDFSIFKSLFWMRTLGTGGILTNYYYQFFANNPYTYYTHIKIVDIITQSYPYEKPLGLVIGEKYWDKDMSANANFWASDGIAAFGDFGVLFASFLVFLILILFNSVSKNYDKLFVILLLIPYMSSLLNSSLFTSMVSGGGFIIILILSFKTVARNPYINKNHNFIFKK